MCIAIKGPELTEVDFNKKKNFFFVLEASRRAHLPI